MTLYWCLFRTIPESLPWLLSKGRVEEAEAIVKEALTIASDIDIYTNSNIVVEVLECSS